MKSPVPPRPGPCAPFPSLVALAVLAAAAVLQLAAPPQAAAAGTRARGGAGAPSAEAAVRNAAPVPVSLRCEYLSDPDCVEAVRPRLSWRLESQRRGAAQSAWRVLVASTPERLARDDGDLWDSGRVSGADTNQIAYGGAALGSRRACHWKVRSWDEQGRASEWSRPALWRMGLLEPGDWSAQWISHRDPVPPPAAREPLHLPPAWHYRREFVVEKPIRRAVVYASALGLYELHCNGARAGESLFQPGWSDYARRVHYRAHDVTALLRQGRNALGAVVADGWYAGYVGYGLLVGYGPHRTGRNLYGRTPALLAQLEIEYADGTRAVVGTGGDWRATGCGPVREADIIMGETYDARAEMPGWAAPGFVDAAWEPAVPADANGRCEVPFHDNTGVRSVDIGFKRPERLQAYAAQPVRVTEELPVRRLTEPRPGVTIADFGRNFAGVVRLRVRGPAGATVRLRFGEMLHRDGTLMTENLRKARAADSYTLRGDPSGETWTPRFTYHGFQYVEITGLPGQADAGTLTGLVVHSDTPATGSFECSDEVLTRFGENARWTQRANFLEVPTDCPQRDERLGWMGDAQAFVRTASFNADIAAFYNKWLDDVAEAQRPFGAYPDYAPYPMGHGHPGKTFGTAWADAGIICPWTVWRVYGDTGVLERHWGSMTRYMDWRQATAALDGGGVSLGNPWGDWLNADDPTPVEYIDTCYHALVCGQMAEMASALGRTLEARAYLGRRETVAGAFRARYLAEDGTLRVPSQSAHVLALQSGVLPEERRAVVAAALAARIAANGHRMSTGFLGTRALLLVLSENGQHDLAARLFQSRTYPSWGYEVVNGATSVWERWDSYTTEHGFDGRDGKQNASMNSFSHYAFGAVMEWAYRTLAGIDTEGPGHRRLRLCPRPPSPGGNPERQSIDWVKARYDSINGPVALHWRRAPGRFLCDVTVPANTTATVVLPDSTPERIREGGADVRGAQGVRAVRRAGLSTEVEVGAGSYAFSVEEVAR